MLNRSNEPNVTNPDAKKPDFIPPAQGNTGLTVMGYGGTWYAYDKPEDKDVHVELFTIKDGVIFGILKDTFTDFKWVSYTWF